MNDLEQACIRYHLGIKSCKYSVILNAMQKETLANNTQPHSISFSKRDITEWVEKKLVEFNYVDTAISDKDNSSKPAD